MATQTVDSHQTSTSDEQTVKFSEAVKATEQINLSSPQESVEDDREKGKADNLHIPDSTLSTSEEKAEDIQVEPPVIEVKKTDETPVVDLPVHGNVKLEKESTAVTEVVAADDETQHKESPSTEPVGGEATELPVIAYLEKSLQEFDAIDNVKSPPEEQPTAELIKKEALEVPAAASAQKVQEQEQASEAVGLPKLEVESSGDTVDGQEKEKPAVIVQSVIVPEKVEVVSVPVEEVEEKKPKITDNPELSVVADSGNGPAAAEEQSATEFVSVEKEPKKEPETGVPEESVEPPKQEVQPIEVVAKESIETVEPPAEKEQPVEVHPIKGLEEVIAKEISGPVKVPKEQEQASEVDPEHESREVIETGISESVEVPKENELLVEVHSAKELVVTAKETSESIEPIKNKEQLDEVLSQKESGEIRVKEVSASFEPPKNKEQVDEGFPVTESGEVKEKETIDSTLCYDEVKIQEHDVIEVEKQEHDVIEVEKSLAPGDDISPPIGGGKVQEEEAQHTVESDKQDSVGQVAKSSPMEDSGKGPETEQPDTEFVSVEKEPKEEPETTCVPEESVKPPKKEAQPIEVLQVKEPVEVVAKVVIETVEPPREKEQPVVIAKEKSESIEPLKNKEQSDEVISQKESVEVIANKVSASFDPPNNKEQADEGFPVTESGKGLEKEQPAKEVINVGKELREEPETAPVPDLSIEPPKKEEPPIDVLPVEEQVEVIAKEIIEIVDPPTEKEQAIEVHPPKGSGEVMEKETTEPTELHKEKEQTEDLPTQESKEVISEKISESVEIPKENELLTEVHPVKELEVIVEDTSESIEPPKKKEQPGEAPSEKESGEVIAKETSKTFEPPKKQEQADESFPVTESREVKGKEISDSTLGSEEVEKQEPEVIELKDGIGELPEITKQVQNTYVEIETVKDEKALVPEDDINPPIEGGKIQEEEAQYAVESDKQDSVGQVAKPGHIEESGKGLEKEQPAKEFVSVNKEPREEPETTHVPELSIEPLKKEEQLVEVLPVEQVEVIDKEIVEAVEWPTEKEQPIEVHPLKGSGEVMEKEIIEPTERPKEKEQATGVQPVQESKEVIAEKISESVEIPKKNELLIEVHPVKELEVIGEDTSESIELPKNKEQPNEVPPEKESGEVTTEEISESFVPPKNMEQADEGFSVTESGELRAKETSGSTLGLEEVEKREPEVTKVKDDKEKLFETTNQVPNNVEVETEAIVKGESVKDEKSLPLRDDITSPLGGEQIHKEEKQYTVESDRQASLNQVAQPSIELAARDFSPQDVEENTSNENEKKESSNINVVAKLSKEEATGVKKVGEENEEKIEQPDKAVEDKYEKTQELTLTREETTPSETAAVVAEKAIDDQKIGEEVDLIAETKIEESTKDEKPASVETGNAEHVNETTKKPRESEVEVKDKETVITGGEIPKVNDKKEVPSKPSHKHSHNILSKVKQSLVKAKKAIIGKSPSSKTLSSEARDDIKVK